MKRALVAPFLFSVSALAASLRPGEIRYLLDHLDTAPIQGGPDQEFSEDVCARLFLTQLYLRHLSVKGSPWPLPIASLLGSFLESADTIPAQHRKPVLEAMRAMRKQAASASKATAWVTQSLQAENLLPEQWRTLARDWTEAPAAQREPENWQRVKHLSQHEQASAQLAEFARALSAIPDAHVFAEFETWQLRFLQVLHGTMAQSLRKFGTWDDPEDLPAEDAEEWEEEEFSSPISYLPLVYSQACRTVAAEMIADEESPQRKTQGIQAANPWGPAPVPIDAEFCENKLTDIAQQVLEQGPVQFMKNRGFISSSREEPPGTL